MVADIVNMVVSYLPTLLFLLMIGFGVVFGVVRGFRKSLILGIQAAASFLICLVFYLIVVNTTLGDTLVVNIANMILGENGLQNTLDVSNEAQTLTQILIEYLPTLLDYGEGVNAVVEENGAYIATLVNFVFHLIYAIIFSIIHCNLVFILYIVYLIAYPERRYKRRHRKTYTKKRLLGMAVGASRALVASLLVLSFMGSGLYTITGGKGEGKMEEHTFDDPIYQEVYDAYRSLDKYGTTGIFKILNAFKDSEGVPYYLYAADIVFSGGLEDTNLNIDKSISFREEISAYTGFSKETLNLMIKYGGDEINQLLANNEEVTMDAIIDVLSKPEFQEEFDELILNFDSKTYFVNLTFSLVTSIINHIDELTIADGMDENTLELIKLLFKDGYLSDYIPEEKDLKDNGIEAESTACLKVNHLLVKEDVLVVYKMLLDLLESEEVEDEQITASTEEGGVIEENPSENVEVETMLKAVKKALPYIKQLSILQDSRKEELEPVLSRFYCFVENKYLTPTGFDPITHTEIIDANIEWIDEINSLIDLAGEVIDLYMNVYDPNKEMLDMAVSIFDKTNEHYEDNIACYEDICDLIATSKMLGKIVSSAAITDKLITEIKNLNAYTYVSEDISFENTYASDGTVTSYGELYYIFNGMKLIGQKGDAELINSLIPKEGEGFNFSTVKQLAEIITEEDETGYSVADYLIESDIFHSVVSAFMVEQSNSDQISLYVPESSLLKDKNGETINLVKKDELAEVLDHLPSLVDSITPLIEGEGSMEDLENMTKTDAIVTLLELDNPIIEGTLSKTLYTVLKDNSMVKIPVHLQSIDSWFLETEHGELNKIVDFINGTNVRLLDMVNASDKLAVISELDDNSVDLMFDSEVLHYTVSNVLLEGSNASEFKIIVPYECREELSDDVIAYLVNKEDIKGLFKGILDLGISGEISSAKILANVAKNKDSLLSNLIIKTSLINFISNNESMVNMLSTPFEYIKYGKEEFLLEYEKANIWEEEIHDLIDCLNEMFDLSNKDDSFVLDETTINSELSKIFTKLNDKATSITDKTLLELCHESELVLNKLTIEMDNILASSNLIPEVELNKVKDEKGYYTYNELKAFVDSINVFEINDILNASQEELENSITDSIFALNEEMVDEKYAPLRKIDVIYDSYVIMYIFSDKLDTSIDGMINDSVLTQIKDNQKVYPKNELVALVDAINELEVQSLDELSNFDFKDVASFNNTSVSDTSKTKLNVIYASNIIGGVITKTINDITSGADAFLVDHPHAYQDDIAIYKESEISTLIDVLDGVDIEAFDVANVNLAKVKAAIYDETTSTTSSYLLVATLSKEISAHDGVVLPKDVIDNSITTSSIVTPYELKELLNAFELLLGTDDLSDWSVDTQHVKLPSAEIREDVSRSVILRASITKMIAETNQEDEELEVWINIEHSIKTKDVNNNDIIVVLQDEMVDMFNALEVLDDGSGQQFIIPAFTLTSVIKYQASMDVLYECDAVKYRVCDILFAQPLFTPTTTFEETSYNLHTKESVVKKVVEYSEIEAFYDKYASLNA